MAQFTKSHLKSLVKECLIEILREGTSDEKSNNNNQVSSITESENKRYTKPLGSLANRRSHLDNVSWNSDDKQQSNVKKNKNLQKNVEAVANSLTSDPVLSSIFQDTAMTTLQEQSSATRMGPGGSSLPTAAAGDNASRMAAQSAPAELFSESAGKWAHLAFSDKIQK